ncbi:hypothetical protein BOX15_Mlig012327g1 [Macrostomum lignano]|nr:hypothetical protein BOX15_Mlig012327g1 [Macrostomum lignano]
MESTQNENSTIANSNDWVKLNVGGKLFLTTRSTLTQKEPDSMLAKMLTTYDGDARRWHNRTDTDGAILVDRSPEYFEPLLNYLRHGRLILDRHVSPLGVLAEAQFYGIQGVMDELNQLVVSEDSRPKSLTRADAIRFLAGTVSGCRLRLQGLNFCRADLSYLDLSGANLSHCLLREANLSGANLTNCLFTRADCSRANFDKANMAGVQMRCAVLDRASMVNVCLEASAEQLAANLEGSSLRETNLENSYLQEANLRVSCLKGARLVGCNLRAAVLAGSDLENADLTGCDLQHANLRGANVVNCVFQDLRTPLHMAQTMDAF